MGELEQARIEARLAREQVMGTVDEIRARLAPRTLAEEAWEGVRDRSARIAEDAWDRSTQIAEDAVELAKARPGATAAVAAGTVALLARHTLINAATRLFSRRDDDTTAAPPPLDGV